MTNSVSSGVIFVSIDVSTMRSSSHYQVNTFLSLANLFQYIDIITHVKSHITLHENSNMVRKRRNM